MSTPIVVAHAEPHIEVRAPRLHLSGLRLLAILLAATAVALAVQGEPFAIATATTAFAGWKLGG